MGAFRLLEKMGIRNPPQIRILTNCDKYHEGKVQGTTKEYTRSVLGWSGGSKAILRNDNYYIPEYLSWGKRIPYRGNSRCVHEGPEVGKNLVRLGTQKAAVLMELSMLPMMTGQDETGRAGWGWWQVPRGPC